MVERLPGRIPGLISSMLVLLAVAVQAQGVAPVNRALASREDLQGALSGQPNAPKLSGRDREIVQQRLEQGDFRMGDRVVVKVQGEQTLSDTFTVRAEQVLQLPDMAPLSLHGVLRSELQDKLQQHVAQYIRAPTVTAEALLRVGVLGGVVKPAYYSVRADQALGDLPTVAGGLSGDADIGKAHILRDGKEFWPRDEVRRAMASGQSLDVLGLQGGDEFVVGRRGSGIGQTVLVLSGVVTLITTVAVLLTK